METRETGQKAGAVTDCTPQRLGEVVPMTDLMDALFRGFAPLTDGAKGGEGRP